MQMGRANKTVVASASDTPCSHRSGHFKAALPHLRRYKENSYGVLAVSFIEHLLKTHLPPPSNDQAEARLETLEEELDEKATELKQREEKSAKFKSELDMLRTKPLAQAKEIEELEAKVRILMEHR